MKAIILAAGQGTRLRPLTNEKPKCLVKLEGKALLEHQIQTLQNCGIYDIHVVAGYKADKITYNTVNIILNKQYASTNMVYTLFCAKKLMTGNEDLIVSYGDIVYETKVLKTLLNCNAPVALTIDSEWRRYWEMRMENPLDDAETLKLNGNLITEIGKKPTGYHEVKGQFMGLIKFRSDTVKNLINVWSSMDRNTIYDEKNFENMYMTSFLQHLIDNKWHVEGAFVKNGWMEIDDVNDLNIYPKLSENNFYRTRT